MSVYFDASNEYMLHGGMSPGIDGTNWSFCVWAKLNTSFGAIAGVGGYGEANAYLMNEWDVYKIWTNCGGWVEVSWGEYPELGTWLFFGIARDDDTLYGHMFDADGHIESISTTDGTGADCTQMWVGESFYGNERMTDGSIFAIKVWGGVTLSQSDFDSERFSIWPRMHKDKIEMVYPILDTSTCPYDFCQNKRQLGFPGGGFPSQYDNNPPVNWAGAPHRLLSIPDVGRITHNTRQTMQVMPGVGFMTQRRAV